jgi:hypothetical protein
MVGVFSSARTRFQSRGEAEGFINLTAGKHRTFALDFSADQTFYFALLQIFVFSLFDYDYLFIIYYLSFGGDVKLSVPATT